MPITTAFLETCRARVAALPELAAFNAAGALADESRAERDAQWHRLYTPGTDGQSAAGRLRQAIRNTVNAEADIHAAAGSGVLSDADRHNVYAELTAESVPGAGRPQTPSVALADLSAALVAAGDSGAL